MSDITAFHFFPWNFHVGPTKVSQLLLVDRGLPYPYKHSDLELKQREAT